uniref:Uncharacterized protein n=1 Tax=Oryza punctata TaxID=4537 RepID=A0A0E0LNX1_ORYPU
MARLVVARESGRVEEEGQGGAPRGDGGLGKRSWGAARRRPREEEATIVRTTAAPRQGRDNSKGRTMRRAESKGKGGERRRCSPCGSRVAARREWPTASTIGSRFILGSWFVLACQVLEHIHRGEVAGNI